MTCSNCKSEVSKTSTYYTTNGKIENCKYCVGNRYQPHSLYPGHGNIRVMRMLHGRKLPAISPAHNNDISRRILNPDNSVSRDYR